MITVLPRGDEKLLRNRRTCGARKKTLHGREMQLLGN
ncbi:hypothetical protein M3J09_006474 [Ascochyta lentis]